MINYGKQSINQEDIDSVIEVLQSDFLTQGPKVPKFETLVKNYCDSKYSVATNSATSALHIACMALDLGPGDFLWTSPNTFVASSNAALYCGASVDFVDINKETYVMSPKALEEKLISARKNKVLPKAVMPVHLCGQSAQMKEIYELSQEYDFKIIEDASHAIGGKYKGNFVGSCKYSDIAVFSFHPVKIITTGEGGMALTNDSELYERMQKHRSHGITSNPDDMYSRPRNEIWNYQQISIGHNYRMTDISAALGISQLKRIDGFIERRTEIASIYDAAFQNSDLITPYQHDDTNSSYHLYPIRIPYKNKKVNQQAVYRNLMNNSININLHYIPVYLQPYYYDLGFRRGHCPEAEKYFTEAISIPIYPDLSSSDQEKIIKIILSSIN
jgi:UDP-4-amino-4,6-dideoxy-N-acetyl-beta-L-altrosamine transaminase